MTAPWGKAMTPQGLSLLLRLIYQIHQPYKSKFHQSLTVLPVSSSTEIGAAFSPSSCEAACSCGEKTVHCQDRPVMFKGLKKATDTGINQLWEDA